MIDIDNASLEELKAFRDELKEQRMAFEAEKREFELRMESREHSLSQNEAMFNMKWKLLEEETRRLAEDQKKFQRRQQFFNIVTAYVEEGKEKASGGNIVNGEMFFQGVANGQALKKRYKDLIKIYHPDSENGDNRTVQEINREYDNLKRALAE